MAGALAALLLLIDPAGAVSGARVVIIDGDTIALPGGERVRLVNIDAPESFHSRCERELIAGLEAKARLAVLLRPANVTIVRTGRDRYGRTLAYVHAGGRDAGDILVAEGLALPWKPGRDAHAARLAHWCGRP